MPLVTTKEMFKKAYEGGYAIGAFNVNNMEIVQGITRAAKKLEAPVILQCSASARKYASNGYLVAMVKAAVEETELPIALHLDHGPDFETCKSCIDGGFTSVMIDGSSLPYEENIAVTKKVVEYAHAHGVTVEGELGTIGGKEEGDTELEANYTKVSEAVEFVERTKVSTLAIGVGTAHGIYKGTPKINVTRIKEIKAAVSAPLVLHGASGLSDEVLSDCIRAGITKINFATELRQAYTAGIKQGFLNNPEAFDPKIYMPEAIEAIKNVIKAKMKTCYHLI